VKELRQVMDYNALTVNQFEIELAKKANRNIISRDNFKTTIQNNLAEFSPVSLDLLLKFATVDDVIFFGEFCDNIRKYDVYEYLKDM
jgi:hypothetical protein